jgi:hypothetical protein
MNKTNFRKNSRQKYKKNKISKKQQRKFYMEGGMQVFVKHGSTYTIEVEPTYTIAQVKSLIQDKVGVPHDQQCLSSETTTLRDDRTLADYNIERESTLWINWRRNGGLYTMKCQDALPVTYPNGSKKIYNDFYCASIGGKRVCDTVLQLKQRIAESGGTSVEQQSLRFKGEVLTDDRTLCGFLQELRKDKSLSFELVILPLVKAPAIEVQPLSQPSSVSADSQEPECTICNSAKAIYAIIPCGHRVLCGDCRSAQLKTCPICRTQIEKILRIF